jgi:hypothetical protein
MKLKTLLGAKLSRKQPIINTAKEGSQRKPVLRGMQTHKLEFLGQDILYLRLYQSIEYTRSSSQYLLQIFFPGFEQFFQALSFLCGFRQEERDAGREVIDLKNIAGLFALRKLEFARVCASPRDGGDFFAIYPALVPKRWRESYVQGTM